MANPVHHGATFDLVGCRINKAYEDGDHIHFDLELPSQSGKPYKISCKSTDLVMSNLKALTADDHAKLDAADVAAQAAEHAAIRDYNATKHADAPVRMARTLPTWRERVDSL
jgi:hypothetical protein